MSVNKIVLATVFAVFCATNLLYAAAEHAAPSEEHSCEQMVATLRATVDTAEKNYNESMKYIRAAGFAQLDLMTMPTKIQQLRELFGAFYRFQLVHNKKVFIKLLQEETDGFLAYCEQQNEKLMLQELKAQRLVHGQIPVTARIANHVDFAVGDYQEKGSAKNCQQDTVDIYSNPGGNYAFLGIYDGHGGPEVSTKLQQEFRHELLGALDALSDHRPVKVEQCIKDVVCRFDDALAAVKHPKRAQQWYGCIGSTALIVLLDHLQKKLIVTNIGNSRAVLYKNGLLPLFNQLTEEHVPSNEGEQKRIFDAGGGFYNARCMGELLVCRAFGDFAYKKALSDPRVMIEPDIKFTALEADDDYLVLGSRGLWGEIQNNEVGKIVRSSFEQSNSVENAARALVFNAIKRKKGDDVTAVVVRFGEQS